MQKGINSLLSKEIIHMNTLIIAIISILILIAYVFDITASKTRIPTVVILLAMGWVLKQILVFFDIHIPDFSSLLPILGTIGLILIVLEGSMELEMNQSKIPILKKSFLLALVPMLVLIAALAFGLKQLTPMSWNEAIMWVTPLGVISSAIAIPSAKNLDEYYREIVTYDSSFSDIFGILLFNLFVTGEPITAQTLLVFSGQLIFIVIISILSTLLLSYILSKINHQVKFVPIIFSILLIYSIAKWFHMPSLVFVLIFGIMLRNLSKLKEIKFFRNLNDRIYNIEVHRFHEVVSEGTFVIRVFFFILFGFLLKTREIVALDTLPYSIGITLLIFFIRWLYLKLSKQAINPLLFIAPRGLITILLFLSIPASMSNDIINNSLIVQVVLLSALMLIIGNFCIKKEKQTTTNISLDDETETSILC